MKEGLLFIIGLAFLIAGGELMVRGAIALSKKLSISALVIGIVVVGFGTSVPELLASLFSVVGKINAPGLAIGNVIGSNIANIILILGLTALINPIVFTEKARFREIFSLLLSVVLLGLAFLPEYIDRTYGVIMTAAMLSYIFWSIFGPEAKSEEVPDLTGPWKNFFFSFIVTAVGIAIMVGGAKLMVVNAVEIARDWHVSETVIGLTIVAVGTSLPELAASLISAIHKRSDLAIGNIIGSNIFNALFIPGLTAIIKPFPVNRSVLPDFAVMTAVTVAFTLFLLRGKIGRAAGALFFAAYVAYMIFIWK
ncbi:calcium/sodium antiporter [bacterium]|nr:calcium/sodium antiporter [bacterium]